MKSRVSVYILWLLGCFVGGMLAALGLATEFLGYLVLFGGLLALGQLGFVTRYFQEPFVWAVSWFFVSLAGWALGSVVAVISIRSIVYDPANPSSVSIFLLSLPWVLLSLGQGVVFAVFSNLRGSMLPKALVSWLLAGSTGGVLVTAVQLRSDGLGAAPEQLSGFLDWLGYVTWYAVLITSFHGTLTSFVLVWFTGGLGQQSEE